MLLGKMGMLRSENLPKIKGPKLLMLLPQGVTHPLVILSLNDCCFAVVQLNITNVQNVCVIRTFVNACSVGSEADEDELMSESEDSNDSWTTSEEFSAEFILRYGSR